MPRVITINAVSFQNGWFQFRLDEGAGFDLSYYCEMGVYAPGDPAATPPVPPSLTSSQPAGGGEFPAGFTAANKTTLRNILGVLAQEISKEKLGATTVQRTGKVFVEQ